MTLIEKESTALADHIAYWDSVRLENILGYYARKEGYTHLGLHPLPTLTVLEYKSKEAIKMKLLLISLSKSQYGNEPWTLAEVSAEQMNSDPKNCFKKKAFTVTVNFDNDVNNSFPYICWEYIYYQDDNSDWHKVAGQVDINGLFFREVTGDISYFTLFQPDAERYGRTQQWSVSFKNQTLFTSVTSSTRPAADTESRAPSGSPTHALPVSKTPRKRRYQADEDTDRQSPTSTSPGVRLRRRQQGESSSRPSTRSNSRRRRGDYDSAPTPEEVGSGTRSVPRQGVTGIRRLQAEAWDPYLINLEGCANSLKCFRNRFSHKHPHLFTAASSVFHWIYSNDENANVGRMLVAFKSPEQRQLFLQSVTIPKGCDYCFGNLDCL